MVNEPVNAINTCVYLGVTVNSKLCWNDLINIINSATNRMLGLLRRTLYKCPQHLKERSYKAIGYEWGPGATIGMHWEVYGDFIKVAEPITSFSSFTYRNYVSSKIFLLLSLNWHFIAIFVKFSTWVVVILTGDYAWFCGDVPVL